MSLKTINGWLKTGTPGMRFSKSAALNFVLAFTVYSLIDWKQVTADHFLTEDLWVTAICFAVGFGLGSLWDQPANVALGTQYEGDSQSKTRNAFSDRLP